MIFLDFLKVKILGKYSPKRTIKKNGEACPRTPLTNAWLRHAPPQKKLVGPPWQILHTPMTYY